MLFRSGTSAIRYFSHNRCSASTFALCKGIKHNSSLSSDNEPLRILFCGTDNFSVKSLEALHKYAQEAGTNVASIDVATRTDKRTGRNFKTLTRPPIKYAAQELGIPLYQFDSFRGWNLPVDSSGSNYINMIIAVSFGLLVPPRILNACRFGGLNIHPSMLPDLKGSAPIEHAIIHGDQSIGVTVQNLHPSKFDEGQIVLQTSSLDIPRNDEILAAELKDYLAPIGGELLVQSLRERLYLQPKAVPDQTSSALRLAHKPKTSDRRIDLTKMTVRQIMRLHRALGKVWLSLDGTEERRVIFGQGVRPTREDELPSGAQKFISTTKPGSAFVLASKPKKSYQSPLFVQAADGQFLTIPELAVSGSMSGGSAKILRMNELFGEEESITNNLIVRKVHL